MNDDSTTRRARPAVHPATERRLAEDRKRRTLPAFLSAMSGRIPAAFEAGQATATAEVPRLEALFAEIEAEIARGRALHPRRYNSHHEAAAVLLEEVFEAWAEVMASDPQALRAELVQVAAVTVRWLQELYRVAPEPGAAEAPAGDPAPGDEMRRPTVRKIFDFITRYADHDGDCACWLPVETGGKCDCGFDAALEDLDRLLPAQAAP